MPIAVAHLGLVCVPALELRCRLEAELVLRQHVRGVDVAQPIVVDVGDIEPHGEVARDGHLLIERFREGAVLRIDVEIVPFEEVVRDIDVWPTIVVHVRDDHPKSERDFGTVYPGRRADIREVAAIVPVEPRSAVGIADVPRIAEPEAADRTWRVADQDEVEVPVVIVVEKCRLRGIAAIRDTVLLGHLLERRNAVRSIPLVDPELIRSLLWSAGASVAEVDVQPSVTIDVRERDAGAPGVLRGAKAARVRDVLESKLATIQVQAWSVEVRDEHNLRQSVAVEVADCGATAVVEVAVREDVELPGLDEPILECDPRNVRRKLREQVTGLRDIRHSRRPLGAAIAGASDGQEQRRNGNGGPQGASEGATGRTGHAMRQGAAVRVGACDAADGAMHGAQQGGYNCIMACHQCGGRP